jgi:membrane-associated protease RseP (regulator of RpoE activity)
MVRKWKFYKSNQNDDFDIEFLKNEVGKIFPYYDIKINDNAIIFFCRIDKNSLEINFNNLRDVLTTYNYIPILRKEKGEDLIYVIKKPIKGEKSIWINIILIISTIITTVITGSILHIGYYDIWNIPDISIIFNLNNLFYGGLLFALPLMSILFIHEMGHYFISRKHGIKTSLPFLIPVPPILPNFNIGTFGALISSHDPMPNRKALFDVGISGPISGFIVAVPVTIIGIILSEPSITNETITGELMLGPSLLFSLLSSWILNIPANTSIDLSLTAFAGWIGLLITSINLLPAGQLDGGHIFRAIFGENQKYIGWLAVIIMIFTGWTFFAIIIIFLMGMMHPPPLNDNTKLDVKRKLLFFIALSILILCYIPFPFRTF